MLQKLIGMDSQLNSLEQSILNEIASFNKDSHPFLKEQITLLRVKSREFTGVGIYVNFDSEQQIILAFPLQKNKTYLSTNKAFYVDSLEYPISFELNLNENGIIEFLEIVSNDEKNWDGSYKLFTIR